MEEVKRLDPTQPILRRLYIYSGNQCAYDGCNHSIIDDTGVYIADLAHIEAAMPGGPRFNSSMTNEERRENDNLLFLCQAHHRITDDVSLYPVDVMKDMKRKHEEKYKKIVDDFNNQILYDVTKRQEYSYPSTLASINQKLDWRQPEEDLLVQLEILKKAINILKSIPQKTRMVFNTMIERSDEHGLVNLDEVAEALDLSKTEFVQRLGILVKYQFVSEAELLEGDLNFSSQLLEFESWNIWLDLSEFATQSDISMEELIMDLRFDLLD